MLYHLGNRKDKCGKRILYQGKDLKTIPTREYFRAEIGYLSKFRPLRKHINQRKFGFGFCWSENLKSRTRLERQVEALKKVNRVFGDITKKIYTISGGKAQRVPC